MMEELAFSVPNRCTNPFFIAISIANCAEHLFPVSALLLFLSVVTASRCDYPAGRTPPFINGFQASVSFVY